MKIISVLMCLVMLSGCASVHEKLAELSAKNNPNADYVMQGISKSDAAEVTQDMANFLASLLPPAKTTIKLTSKRNVLHAELREQLTRRGFGVVESDLDKEIQGVSLGYYVTPMDRGLLVRIRFQGKVASRYYDRMADGHLSLHSRFTVRAVSEVSK